MFFTFSIGVSSNQFNTYGIIQSFFIHYISNSIFFTGFDVTTCQFFILFAGNNFNRIPQFGNLFLPCGNFFCFSIVVSYQFFETFSFFGIEFRIVIIQLTLHSIMRSYLSNRVLDSLHPTFRIALTVTCIVQRQDFIFQNTIDSSSIQLVLMLLVLISTFFCQRPSCTFTVAFQPPSVEYREVHNTIHQSFLA